MIPPAPLFQPERAPPGFFADVETRLGRRWRLSFREFENLFSDLSCSRGHVNFLRRCLQYELVPSSFQRKVRTINNREERKIAQQIQERMKVHLDSHISDCFWLENEILWMRNEFDRRLRFHWRRKLYNLCLHRLKSETSRQEETKEKKFMNLLLKNGTSFRSKRERDKIFKLDKHKVVVDLCSDPLSEAEKSVLALGPKFAVTPRVLPLQDLLIPVLSASDIIKKSGTSDCETSGKLLIFWNAPNPLYPTCLLSNSRH